MENHDVLVVGAGIGGMESALKLGDMGYRVLLVEKEPSVGGKMILLSKVFPTLDCASCISTPKMAASIHHPNVDTLTYTEVEHIERRPDGRFDVRVRTRPGSWTKTRVPVASSAKPLAPLPCQTNSTRISWHVALRTSHFRRPCPRRR